MGASTEKLEQLRPVTFKLKTDPQGTVQYGLIAEELDKVYPELVIRNAEGRIDGVRYEELTPMLLNEMQQQRHRIAAQEERISAQEERIAAQERQLREVQLQLAQVRQPRQQLTALEAPRAPAPVPQPSAPAADGL
jgi:phage shock protein A